MCDSRLGIVEEYPFSLRSSDPEKKVAEVRGQCESHLSHRGC